MIEKLFLPFFTTKPAGEGTGLGLSISKGLIQDHHGHFYYDTNCKHTKFVIILPQATTGRSSCLRMRRRSLAIYSLVDDSKFSCKREGELIEKSVVDAQVSLAFLPSEAIQMIRDEKKSFDLIFLDFNMPEMNGLELLDNLQELVDPSQVILLTATSAFTTKAQSLQEGVRLIQKPLSYEKLRDCLGESEIREKAS